MHVSKPGIYTMTAPQYHADPCPSPSLSSSVARTLIFESPRHAWTEHPRLNPDHEVETKKEYDLGTAAHVFMLNDTRNFEIIHADAFRTNDAKAQRDGAYAKGKTPILSYRLPEIEHMVEEGRMQIAAHRESPDLLGPKGKSEQTVCWEENGVWLRVRLDWLQDDYLLIGDYKTTGESANPENWQRTCYNMGTDVQAAIYRRGVRAVTGKSPRFQFAVQETKPPFALSIIELSPQAMDMADERVNEAIDLWRHCLTTKHWPGYPAVVCHIDPPGYEIVRHADRKGRRQMMRDVYGKDHLQLMNDWQRPVTGRD